MEKIIKLIEKYFENEDKVLKKVDDKFNSFMVSRNISCEKEREELLNLRKTLLKEVRHR